MIDRPDTGGAPANLRKGVDRAVVQARRDVIERHRQLGVQLAVWRDGQVVLLDPHEVALPQVPADDTPDSAS